MIQIKLKTLRKQKGLSPEDLAKILSTHTSSYSRKERGKTRIRSKEWKILADALHVHIEEIRDEEIPDVVPIDRSNNMQNYNNPIIILDNLQDYVALLKKEKAILLAEIEVLRLQKRRLIIY